MPAAGRNSADDVFINCPFDQDYAPLLRSLVFAIYACGFRPRSALELDDGGQTRIDKLFTLIDECRFGIHDISRTELDRSSGLPRFNMPLELGIFLGAKRYGRPAQRLKRVLILDVDRYRYQRFISDLAGMDIHAHAGDAVLALRETRDWLANVSRRVLPGPERLQSLYAKFAADLPAVANELGFDPVMIPYVDYERIVISWLLRVSPAT